MSYFEFHLNVAVELKGVKPGVRKIRFNIEHIKGKGVKLPRVFNSGQNQGWKLLSCGQSQQLSQCAVPASGWSFTFLY